MLRLKQIKAIFMNLRTFFPRFLWNLLLLTLAGCNLPALPAAQAASLTLTEPLDGAHYTLGELLPVRSQITFAQGAATVDLLANGQVIRSDHPNPALRSGSILQPWQPPQAGTYTLQTRALSASGVELQSAQVTIQVGDAVTPAAPTTDSEPSATPLPENSPMPSLTPSPTLGPPLATSRQDANCRFGPGQVYDITGALLAGQSAPIVGRNAATSWWVIQLPNAVTCWVWAEVVTVSGDTSQVPEIAPPPTPTPLPSPTPMVAAPLPLAPGGTLTCRSSVVLEWSPVTHPNGIDHYEWLVNGPAGSQTGQTTDLRVEIIVACKSDYTWQVRAVDGQGNAGPYSELKAFNIR